MSIAKNHYAKVIIKDVFVVFSGECFYLCIKDQVLV